MGLLEDRTHAELYTLRNDSLTLQLCTYGARVVSLETPDRMGEMGNVALGFPTLTPYLQGRAFFLGAIVGRVANRIANGRFTLEGKEYQVPANNGPNALHGGPCGFDTRNWTPHADEHGVTFSLFSDDGDQGFPGTLHARVRYSLEGSTVRIETQATTDMTTVVSLANHTYFNLAGEGSPSILEHELSLEADAFTPVNATQIPTGEIRSVVGSPFDFRMPRRIGDHIDADNEQIRAGSGYDHNFVVRGEPGVLRPVATLYEASCGRVLEVSSTEPGVQFYSGNFLDGGVTGISGRPYGRRSGLCLETQGFPDAVNQPKFPSVVLLPGRRYLSRTEWTFGTR